jgi:hypothetical protein
MDLEVQKEINELKAALWGASNAFHELRVWVVEGKKPTPDGIKLFDDALAEIDNVVNEGTIRGFGAP